jgi:hypothetical protein
MEISNFYFAWYVMPETHFLLIITELSIYFSIHIEIDARPYPLLIFYTFWRNCTHVIENPQRFLRNPIE